MNTDYLEKVSIRGVYDDGTNKIECFGHIVILRIDEKHHTAYVSWQMLDENENFLASASRNFTCEERFNADRIFQMVLACIEKYRVARRKVFSQVRMQ